MKKRTKEEAAAAMRASRARKKAQKAVTPAAVTPRKTVTPITPVTPAAPVSCLDCARLRAEVSRLKDRVRELEARPVAVKVDLPHLPPVARPLAPAAAGKALDKTEAEALRLRVVADKVSRIRGYSLGHSIGSVRA